MLLGGALRGRSPRTREGRIGPTAQKCSGQWLVVSCQRLHLVCLRVERGLDVGPLLPEVQESSPQYWDAPPVYEEGRMRTVSCYTNCTVWAYESN